MKVIKELIPDIYQLVEKKDGWFSTETSQDLSLNIVRRLSAHFNYHSAGNNLRMSKLGPQCPKALWYSVRHPELAEGLPPWAEVKYSFGHVLEALAIQFAKSAGHTVEGEQDEIVLDGITGHRDCVIDGCIVDVKSASSRSFSKWKQGLKGSSLEDLDMFGYLSQLDAYVVGSRDDPLVRVKDRGYLLFIQKELGHMHLHEHIIREQDIRNRIAEYKQIVERDTAPKCTCRVIKDGESGNLKLGVPASYSAFKYCCFPNLRTFLYSKDIRYLTHVERLPDVVEIDRNGNIVQRL